MEVSNSNSVNFNNPINSKVESKSSSVPSILEKISAYRTLSGMDGASLLISDELLNRELTNKTEISNSQNTIALMQIADGTLNTLSEGASQIAELSIKANSGLLNDEQKTMIDSEVNSIKESMQDSINSATFNGKPIFDNEFSSMNFDTIDISSLSANDLNAVEEFSKNINQMRSDIAGNIDELNSSINNKMDSVVESASARSNIEDNDLDKDIIELNKEKLVEEAQLFTQVQNGNYIQKQAIYLLT